MRSSKGRAGRRGVRAAAAGSLALGAATLTVWGLAPPAYGGAEPTTIVDCLDGSVSGRFTGFPPDETLSLRATVHGNTVVDGYPIFMDGTGAGSTGVGVPVGELPAEVSATLFRDLNGNGRWNYDVDDTLYQGTGTVTSCPQSVTLSPK